MKTTFQIKDGRVLWVKDWPEKPDLRYQTEGGLDDTYRKYYDYQDAKKAALASAVEVETGVNAQPIFWAIAKQNGMPETSSMMGPYIKDGIYHVDLDGEMVIKEQLCRYVGENECYTRQVAVFKPKAESQEELLAEVNKQAEDEGLWFQATTASEAYLQQALRKLHSIIESHK